MKPTQETIKALAIMSAGMPKQGEIKEDAYLKALMKIASLFRPDAVVQAAEDFFTGKEGSGFAPTAKEFREHCLLLHQRKEAVDAAMAREKLPPPRGDGLVSNFSNAKSILRKNRQDLLDEGRKIVAVNVNFGDYEQQCKRNTYPAGSTWIMTGEVFSPRKETP